ncbi:MAG: hypothetical protein M0027_12760 [Candidatus Dormibacteraeota bacterium]|jgi:hypothetical protein|nr:hypothetical protein [Candidatus Dormibacteraeota bacterium]
MGADELGPGSLPPVTLALRPKGRDTLAVERDMCRAPIWHPRPQSADDLAVPQLVLYGLPLRRLSGSALTVGDQRIFADVATRWVRAGCPPDRRVLYSLGDAARALGGAAGGKEWRLARASLVRLRGATYESVLRQAGGAEAIWIWGLIDDARFVLRGHQDGHVTISQVMADLVAGGAVTYLHAPTWDGIRARDEIAARLWVWLEAESLPAAWRYPVFGAGGLADMLGLRWARRWRVARRIAMAAEAICDADRRYRLTLTEGLAPGQWHLTAARDRAARQGGGPLPVPVLRAWRRAYEGRRPSASQIEVVGELLTRWEPAEIAAMLLAGGEGDALAEVMAADRARSVERLAAAGQAKHEVAVARRVEAGEGQSYVDTLAALGVTLPRWATGEPLGGPPVPPGPVSGTGPGGTEDWTLRDSKTGLCGTGPRSTSASTVVCTVVPTVGDSPGEAPSSVPEANA